MPTRARQVAWAVACALVLGAPASCGDDAPASSGATPGETGGETAGETPAAGGSSPAPSAGDPSVGGRVSSTGGPEGGVVVLWPRLVPADQADALRGAAEQVQGRLRALAERVLPGRPVEVRPAPERACPQGGCVAVALGAVLFRREGGCVAAATISRPGRSPTRIVPWAGEMTLRQSEVGFREPPESQIRATDMVPCDALLDGLAEGDAAVEAALREAAP